MNSFLNYRVLVVFLFVLFSCKEEKERKIPDNNKNNIEKEVKNPLKLTIDKPEKVNYVFGDR